MATIPIDYGRTTVSIDSRRSAGATKESATVTMPLWTSRVFPMMNANQAPRGGFFRSNGRFVTLTDDEIQYLTFESARRGVSIQDVYEEDLAAERELTKITPNNTQLLSIADCFPVPQEWYDE